LAVGSGVPSSAADDVSCLTMTMTPATSRHCWMSHIVVIDSCYDTRRTSTYVVPRLSTTLSITTCYEDRASDAEAVKIENLNNKSNN